MRVRCRGLSRHVTQQKIKGVVPIRRAKAALAEAQLGPHLRPLGAMEEAKPQASFLFRSIKSVPKTINLREMFKSAPSVLAHSRPSFIPGRALLRSPSR